MRAVAALIAVAAAVTGRTATAAPMAVVVRAGDDATALAVTRLRGQVADLDLALTDADAPLELSLDAQFAAAARLAADDHARAVVWFIARDGGLAVAVATPADRRLFVREIPAAEPSAVAEAAALAARGALRAIALGGAIGVEVPARAPPDGLEVAVGWQVALDGGADAGAHAMAVRTALRRGRWAGGLALTFGPPLARRDPAHGVDLELTRTSAALTGAWSAGGFALGVTAGAILYRRTTISAATGLAATPGATTVAFGGGPELRWHWRPRRIALGIEAAAGLEVVIGAPELAIARAGTIESLGHLGILQPRFSLSIIAGLP
jgi:hypothetical protein